MSQPSRPRDRGTAQSGVVATSSWTGQFRWRQRSLMAPVVATFPLQAGFTAAPTPTNTDLGTVVVSREHDGHDRHRGADHVGVGADADLVVRR